MIVGTAGHIDHGKTALVRALTGVDTDRLPEEKRRGITIELGFAPLPLPGVGTLGVVDVPGHEAFVRTMLAGATGVDLALLVVAADEGVMPQTREHVAILALLGVRAGVVALTKCDLADDEWLALVREDVATLLRDTPLAGSPVVSTSAATGAGLDALRAALADAARAVPRRDAADLFRMPVDRAFTVRGTGTVVTGTVWSGTLARDATVRIHPGGRLARVRGTQSHGAAVDRVAPGSRAAIALAGVELEHVGRGSVLVADESWRPTGVLRAEVTLLDTAPRELTPRTRVRFHLGTADVAARVVAARGALAPGARASARIVLDESVLARAGDRFVLRSTSPVTTIGGGVVTDPLPAGRRVRPIELDMASAVARLRALLAEAGSAGVEVTSLPVRVGLTPADVVATLGSLAGVAVVVGARLYTEDVVRALRDRLRAMVDEYHRREPLEAGASLQSVRAALGAAPDLVDEVLRRATEAGDVEVVGGSIRMRGWTPAPGPEQRRILSELQSTLDAAGHEPPSVAELSQLYGAQTPALLRLLERQGSVRQVEEGRYYSVAALRELLGALRRSMQPGREYGPSELREVLGFSRKYLIPFLEYADRHGVTERRAGGRVLVGTQLAPEADVP